MIVRSIVFIVIAALLAVCGNLTLKKGMNALGSFDLVSHKLFTELLRIYINPLIIAGLVFYVLSTVFWLKVLSQEDVSKAVPILTGINFTFIGLGSLYLFHEHFPIMKIAGIAVIFAGIFLVVRS